MGSPGVDNAAAYGGGTISLSMKKLLLSGIITARGGPKSKDEVGTYLTHGGSGGYILIQFTNRTSDGITFGSNASVNAEGGLGVNNGNSGSGGRAVVTNYQPPSSQYISIASRFKMAGGDIENGKGTKPCSFGAAGTLYFNVTDSLFIRNKNRDGLDPKGHRKPTPLTYRSGLGYIAQFTNVWNGATITYIPDKIKSELSFKNLEMYSNSQFIESTLQIEENQYKIFGTKFVMDGNSTFITGKSSDATSIELDGELNITEGSSIQYAKQLTLKTGRKMTIDGELLMLDNRQAKRDDVNYKAILHSGGDMNLGSKVNIFCDY